MAVRKTFDRQTLDGEKIHCIGSERNKEAKPEAAPP